MNLCPPQVEQRDEDRRGARPAPPNDVRHELFETAILVVHPIRQGKDTLARPLGRFEPKSMGSHVRGRVDDVIYDEEVSRVDKRDLAIMKDKLTNNTAVLGVELEEIQQILWVVVWINERGGVETRHGVGRGERVQLGRLRDCGVEDVELWGGREDARLNFH